MIIRRAASSLLLISQPDHAALAERIMRRWRRDGLSESPRRDAILLAVAEHDNGWREPDAAPIVDVATGRLLDFIEAPDDVRRGVWPRGVERLAGTPYAGALVAQHALHIFRRYRSHPQWAPFFADMEAARDRHLRAAAPATPDQLLADYVFLRVGDLLSLTFCNGWSEAQMDVSGYAARLDGTRLIVTPDPFGGREVALEIVARELPDRPFASADEASEAFRRAPTVTLTGIASGG